MNSVFFFVIFKNNQKNKKLTKTEKPLTKPCHFIYLLKSTDLISNELVDVLILRQEIAPVQPSLCPHGPDLLRGLMEKKAHTFNQAGLKRQKSCISLHSMWKCLIQGFMLDIPFLCRATGGSLLAARQPAPEAQEALRSP